MRRRTVGEFSKGMQRRIGLAQALINDPDLIILDEPTSGLDPIGCREVKDLIMALARRGKTIILSSHLLADVEDVCDRVVIYYGGRIQAMGPLKDLLATPDSVRITAPALKRETMQRVLEIIRQDVKSDQVRVDTPTQNLESYFLGVVQQARRSEQSTSGATAGNRVAAYLAGDAEAESRAGPDPGSPGRAHSAEAGTAGRGSHSGGGRSRGQAQGVAGGQTRSGARAGATGAPDPGGSQRRRFQALRPAGRQEGMRPERLNRDPLSPTPCDAS